MKNLDICNIKHHYYCIIEFGIFIGRIRKWLKHSKKSVPTQQTLQNTKITQRCKKLLRNCQQSLVALPQVSGYKKDERDVYFIRFSFIYLCRDTMRALFFLQMPLIIFRRTRGREPIWWHGW